MVRIFISHAAKDEALVEEFVDLLQVGVGVHPDDIFCSSLPGMNIPTGADFITYIKTQVKNPDLVLLMISPEFLKSQFCHHEAGASWALSLPIFPIIVPPLDYADVRGVLAGSQSVKLGDKESLNDLRDDITEKLGLNPYRTSHWERKRDKFLARLGEMVPKGITEPSSAKPEELAGRLITSSGPWMKLDDRFYKVARFERHGSANITLQLAPTSPVDDAALDRLRPQQYGRGRTIGFAYQNEGGLARVEKATSVSHGDSNVWSLDLTCEEDQRGEMWNDVSHTINDRHYSPDDIAEMRAGRLLINEPPPPRRRSRGIHDDSVESLISGWSDCPVKTDECIVRNIVAANRDNLETGLCWARLETVFRLKATRIVESILELSLAPVVGDKLRVRFRGQRPFRYQGETPEIITVEGDCDLA
jgi:hypothetical protein